MDGLDALLLVLAAALVPIAGMLAAADAAITMVSPARLEEMAREGRRGASSLLTITQDRPRYTNLLLLLRITAEITATVMVAKVALTGLGFQFWVGVLLVAVMVLVTYVVIGVLPRTIGRKHPYSVGLALAGPTRGLARLLAPVASLLILIGNAITPGRGFREGPFSSDIELRELVDIAGSRGVVEEAEREMLQSVFDLGDTIVREVMVPRTEVVWIERDKTLRQALTLASRSGMSRIPVIGDDLDDTLGVVYLKDMVARALTLDPQDAGPGLTELMRVPVFVPESKNVDDLLREMQRDRSHFAVVVDEYGGTAGIVTIEDILEEIVGEITDEYDADTPAPVEPLPGGAFRVSARLPVEDLGELFDVELDDDEVDTVGGLLAQLIGRVPLPGSQASVEGLFLHGEPGVDRRGRPRVQTVLVRRLTTAELAAQEAERERENREREDQLRAEERENAETADDETDAGDADQDGPADRDTGPADANDRPKSRKKKKKKDRPPADRTAPEPESEPSPEPGSDDHPETGDEAKVAAAAARRADLPTERAERNPSG